MASQNGPRITKLSKALEKAVSASARPLPKRAFVACFDTQGDAEAIQQLSSAFDKIHQALQDRVEANVETMCSTEGVGDKLNYLDHILLASSSLKELSVDDMEIDMVDSPLAQVQQATMEIKREELKWLQKTLKQEQEKGKQLREQASKKQQELIDIIELVNTRCNTLQKQTKGFQELQVPDHFSLEQR